MDSNNSPSSSSDIPAEFCWCDHAPTIKNEIFLFRRLELFFWNTLFKFMHLIDTFIQSDLQKKNKSNLSKSQQ